MDHSSIGVSHDTMHVDAAEVSNVLMKTLPSKMFRRGILQVYVVDAFVVAVDVDVDLGGTFEAARQDVAQLRKWSSKNTSQRDKGAAVDGPGDPDSEMSFCFCMFLKRKCRRPKIPAFFALTVSHRSR